MLWSNQYRRLGFNLVRFMKSRIAIALVFGLLLPLYAVGQNQTPAYDPNGGDASLPIGTSAKLSQKELECNRYLPNSLAAYKLCSLKYVIVDKSPVNVQESFPHPNPPSAPLPEVAMPPATPPQPAFDGKSITLPKWCASVSTPEDCVALWKRVQPRTSDRNGNLLLLTVVTEAGHVTGTWGQEYPSVTIAMFDPDNSNPYLRVRTLIVPALPWFGGTQLQVNHMYLGYCESSNVDLGYAMILGTDKKGRPRIGKYAIKMAL
jgi:hypothetical protein